MTQSRAYTDFSDHPIARRKDPAEYLEFEQRRGIVGDAIYGRLWPEAMAVMRHEAEERARWEDDGGFIQ